jgi:hypothetical protein
MIRLFAGKNSKKIRIVRVTPEAQTFANNSPEPFYDFSAAFAFARRRQLS